MILSFETEHPEVLCRKFDNWLVNALPGDKYCYYFGQHIAGRKVGRLAYKAYEDGDAILFQRRETTGFSFWAEKKSRYV